MSVLDGGVRTAHMVASVLLGRPDEGLREAWPLLARSVATLPFGEVRNRLTAFLVHVAATSQTALQSHHTAVLGPERSRRFRLTCHSSDDAAEREGAMHRFEGAFRTAGFGLSGEEPADHLAAVCELSARGAVEPAVQLLREHRAALTALREELETEGSPYAHVVAAVQATLPPPGPRERRAVPCVARGRSTAR
ncbi:nitrate reductase molybdenum cofactor assembly chaperone [Streptosporangium sp. NPDC004379]|uniref:nitrate reductase molybdenum cofactor assembly chaperone n=1 Tax=Streptosporangium sp. NPDC004379 TaxID=3366189 RepID=UPI0036CFB264